MLYHSIALFSAAWSPAAHLPAVHSASRAAAPVTMMADRNYLIAGNWKVSAAARFSSCARLLELLAAGVMPRSAAA